MAYESNLNANRPVLRYGDVIVVLGRSDATLTRRGMKAERVIGHHPEQAVRLRIAPATPAVGYGDRVQTDVALYLEDADDGCVLERSELMYYDHHWGVGRFKFGFVDKSEASQFATFSFDNDQWVNQPVRLTASGRSDGASAADQQLHDHPAAFSPVGLTFGGTLTQRRFKSHPATCDRRYLTVRSADQPLAVNDGLQGDEQLILIRVSEATVAPGDE